MGFGRVSMVLVEYLPSLIGFSNEAIAVRSVWADWFPIEYVFLAPQRSQKKKEKKKKRKKKKKKEKEKAKERDETTPLPEYTWPSWAPTGY